MTFTKILMLASTACLAVASSLAGTNTALRGSRDFEEDYYNGGLDVRYPRNRARENAMKISDAMLYGGYTVFAGEGKDRVYYTYTIAASGFGYLLCHEVENTHEDAMQMYDPYFGRCSDVGFPAFAAHEGSKRTIYAENAADAEKVLKELPV